MIHAFEATITKVVLFGTARVIMLPAELRSRFAPRTPIKVSVNGHHFRTEVSLLTEEPSIELRWPKSRGRLRDDDMLKVTLELDLDPVIAPPDLEQALTAAGAFDRWRGFAHAERRNHVIAVEEAPGPQARAGRIQGIVNDATRVSVYRGSPSDS